MTSTHRVSTALGRIAARATNAFRIIRPASAEQPAGGWPIHMIRPDMKNIPQVPFPEGFGIRTMKRDEPWLWTDIHRDAEPHGGNIRDDLFASQFGTDPGDIETRCLFITDPDGEAVGTISAWYDPDFRGEMYGRIHWVAVRHAYQRRGLAKAALSYAMSQLAEWHDKCYLDTGSGRLVAIRMYLGFGFVPYMEVPNAHEGWSAVRANLDHPVLEKLDLG